MKHGQCKQYTLRDIKVKPNMYIECSIFSNKIARHFHILSLHQTIPYIYWTVLIQDSASCLEKIFIIACIFFLPRCWNLCLFDPLPHHLFVYLLTYFFILLTSLHLKKLKKKKTIYSDPRNVDSMFSLFKVQ